MDKKLTYLFTLLGAALCLINYLGMDPDDIFLFMFSVPVWLIETVADIHYVNVFLVYALTVASYALIGWFGDRFLQGRKKTKT